MMYYNWQSVIDAPSSRRNQCDAASYRPWSIQSFPASCNTLLFLFWDQPQPLPFTAPRYCSKSRCDNDNSRPSPCTWPSRRRIQCRSGITGGRHTKHTRHSLSLCSQVDFLDWAPVVGAQGIQRTYVGMKLSRLARFYAITNTHTITYTVLKLNAVLQRRCCIIYTTPEQFACSDLNDPSWLTPESLSLSLSTHKKRNLCRTEAHYQWSHTRRRAQETLTYNKPPIRALLGDSGTYIHTYTPLAISGRWQYIEFQSFTKSLTMYIC